MPRTVPLVRDVCFRRVGSFDVLLCKGQHFLEKKGQTGQLPLSPLALLL